MLKLDCDVVNVQKYRANRERNGKAIKHTRQGTQFIVKNLSPDF